MAIISTYFIPTNLFYAALVVTICLVGCYHWKRRRLYIMGSKIHGPPAWPIVGNAFWFSGNTEDILSNLIKLFNIYKPPMRAWLGHKLFFAISRPEDMEVVMNSPDALEKENLYKFSQPVTGLGIFSADVPRWKRNRKIIMQTFNQKILNTFIPIYEEQAKILVRNLEKFSGCGVFDVFPVVSMCTLDIICETAMGIKVNSQSGQSDYVDWLNRCLELCYLRMFQLWLHPDFIFNMTSLSKEMNEKSGKMNEFARQIIRRKRMEYSQRKTGDVDAKHEPNSSAPTLKRKAFLDHLIEISEEESYFTDEDILYEVNTLLVAGNDSTASMDSFAFIMLGMHPEVQDRVYTELEDIFEGRERPLTYDDLRKMKYLEMVIKETMRLFPVGPVIVRAITEDLRLDSCIMPKGSSCVLAIIHTHRHSEFWPNPLEFNPDRFLPEEVSKRHPYSYIPFSGGPRNCIGPRYAMMAMKTVIATVVRSYKIGTDYKKVSDVKVKADLMIKAANGYRVSFERRR